MQVVNTMGERTTRGRHNGELEVDSWTGKGTRWDGLTNNSGPTVRVFSAGF